MTDRMIDKNEILRIIYRTMSATIGLWSIFMTLRFFSTGGSETLSFGDGSFTNADFLVGFYFLTKFTFWSNFICLIVITACLFDDFNNTMGLKSNNKILRFLLKIKFISTVMFTATLIIYGTLLGNPLTLAFWNDLDNLFQHVLFPLLFILDWFVFSKKGKVKFKSVLLSFVFPLLYAAIIVLCCYFIPNFRAPYFFFDIKTMGVIKTFVWIGRLIAIFVVIGCFYLICDKTFVKKSQEKR